MLFYVEEQWPTHFRILATAYNPAEIFCGKLRSFSGLTFSKATEPTRANLRIDSRAVDLVLDDRGPVLLV